MTKEYCCVWFPAAAHTLILFSPIPSALATIMRTDSVVVDSLLGQGEALDCYNQQLQNIAVEKAQLENDQLTLGLQVISNLDTYVEKADKFKKVFGPCCDVAQSGCGCNYGAEVAR